MEAASSYCLDRYGPSGCHGVEFCSVVFVSLLGEQDTEVESN